MVRTALEHLSHPLVLFPAAILAVWLALKAADMIGPAVVAADIPSGCKRPNCPVCHDGRGDVLGRLITR